MRDNQYKVVITEDALTDLNMIFSQIKQAVSSPASASRRINRIIDKIESLDSMPDRIRIVDFEPAKSRKLRCLLVDKYSVFFFISDDTVKVTNVLYSSSDIPSWLQ